MFQSHTKQIPVYQLPLKEPSLKNCKQDNRTNNYHFDFLEQEEVTSLAGRNPLKEQIAIRFPLLIDSC
jgi:hypothetical protein